MRRIPEQLLKRMAEQLSEEDRDEMAIPSYLHRNPFLRWIAWRRVEVVARHMREMVETYFKETPPVMMDFGCGTGVLFDEASQLSGCIYGVDLVLDAAKLLVGEWGLDKVTLLKPDQALGQVPEGSVDMIVAPEVLEHIDSLAPTLEFFRSRLTTRGQLLVSLPTEGRLYKFGRWLAGFPDHYHHHNAASVHGEIVAAGFHPNRIETIPAPGPLAIYWVISYHLTPLG